MTVTVYCVIGSPSARSVIMTLKSLDIPYELKLVDIVKGDQLSKEYLKLNPQHTVPTIQDEDGFAIWESHAINAYLVNKYGKDDKLYPKEPKARAVIDQRLHFDTGTLFPQIRKIAIEAVLKKTATKMTNELKAPLEEAYEFLEKFLEGKQYIAGNTVTIADFSIMTTLGNAIILVPLNKGKFPLLVEYVKRCELNIPGLKELNDEGIQAVVEKFKSINFELPSS